VSAVENSEPIHVVIALVKSSPDENESRKAQRLAIIAAIAVEESRDGRKRIVDPKLIFSEENKSGYDRDRGPETEASFVNSERLKREGKDVEHWAYNSNRLGRGSGRKDEARSVLEVSVRMTRAGVRLRSATDDEYLSDPLFVAVASKGAHKFSEDLSVASTRGRLDLALRGDWNGRHVDGYRALPRLRPAPAEVEFCPERHPVIRTAYDLTLKEPSSGAVMRALNGAGLLSRHEVRVKGQPITYELVPWTARRVREALRLPFYAGLQIHQGEVVALGNWPALIELDEWEFVQLRLDARAKQHAVHTPPIRRRSHNSILGGLCKCGACGSSMHVIVNRPRQSDGVQKIKLHCADSRETGGCDAPRIDAEPIEARLLASLEDLGVDLEQWVADRTVTAEADRAQITTAIEATDAEITRLETDAEHVRAEYRTQVRSGRTDAAEFAADMTAEIKREREQAEHRRAELQATLDAVDPSSDVVFDLFTRLQESIKGKVGGTAETAVLNERIREVLDHIDVSLDGDLVRLRPVLSRTFLESVALDAKDIGLDGVIAAPEDVARAYAANSGLPAEAVGDGLGVELPPMHPLTDAGARSWARPLSRRRA
jgi:hypothetical protein